MRPLRTLSSGLDCARLGLRPLTTLTLALAWTTGCADDVTPGDGGGGFAQWESAGASTTAGDDPDPADPGADPAADPSGVDPGEGDSDGAADPSAPILIDCAPGEAATPWGCEPCPAGFRGDGVTCTPCPAGTDAPDAGSAACSPCASGEVAPYKGWAQCEPCPAHTWATSDALFCMPCPAGSFADAGASECVPCPAGTMIDPSDLHACLPCPDGTVASGLSKRYCEPCPAGTCNTADHTWCVPC